MLMGLRSLEVTLETLRAIRKRAEAVLAANPGHPGSAEHLDTTDRMIRLVMLEKTLVEMGLVKEEDYNQPFLVEVVESRN